MNRALYESTMVLEQKCCIYEEKLPKREGAEEGPFFNKKSSNSY